MARKVKFEEYTLVHDIWVKMDRFAELQKPTENGCIEWTGPKHRQGYGFIGAINDATKKRLMVTVHRFVARLKLGRALKKGEVVVHSCSNPACCNPDHLIIGTLSTRNKIMTQNGRAAKTRKRKDA